MPDLYEVLFSLSSLRLDSTTFYIRQWDQMLELKVAQIIPIVAPKQLDINVIFFKYAQQVN